MALFKLVFQFSGGVGTQALGFSETYYRDSTNIQEASKLDAGFIGNRVSLLDPVYRLNQVRVSDFAQPRVTTIVRLNQVGIATAGFNAAMPEIAAVINLASGFIPARRKLWMRGCSAIVFNFNSVTGFWGFSSLGLNLIQNWLNSLFSNNYVIPKRHPITDVGFGNLTVTALVPVVGASLTTVTTQVAHPYVPGQLVTFGLFNAKDVPGLNGLFQVVAVPDNTHFVVRYTLPRLEAILVSTGRVRAYGVIDGATIDPGLSKPAYVGIRKSRRPFTGGRGSRRSPLRGLRPSP